jgi:hypothetical protein
MSCKYCHLNTHYIDKCPTIICKKCKDIGHPQWLCKQKKDKFQNKKNDKDFSFGEDTKKYNPIISQKNTEKNIINKNIVNKNINYYLGIEKKLWGDLIVE